MAHELGHIIFASKHQKIALDFDLIRKKKEE
jgi:Zn-dependent peptidase ImmA (M78 family)